MRKLNGFVNDGQDEQEVQSTKERVVSAKGSWGSVDQVLWGTLRSLPEELNPFNNLSLKCFHRIFLMKLFRKKNDCLSTVSSPIIENLLNLSI